MKSNTFVIKKVEFPISRVVYRGYNYASADGGVSSANTSHDASYSYAFVGSRLEI
jgi:hypothetical protein